MHISSFCARHFLALFVTVAVPCVLWTVAYLALLLWAMFTGAGIGGPLAYPAGLLFFFITTVIATLLLLFPSTALAELFGRQRRFPILAQIPISVAILALICLAVSAIATAVAPQAPFGGLATTFGVLFVTHLLPLGLYWWAAQGGPVLLSLFRRFRETLRL